MKPILDLLKELPSACCESCKGMTFFGKVLLGFLTGIIVFMIAVSAVFIGLPLLTAINKLDGPSENILHQIERIFIKST